MEQKKTWAIIGGGILGMTLALRLSQKGYKVTIFESAEKAGGLTSSWQMDVGRSVGPFLSCDTNV